MALLVYKTRREMQRIADALFDLVGRHVQAGDYRAARLCLKEARELADVAAKIEVGPRKPGPREDGLLRMTDRLRLQEALARRRAPIPVALTMDGPVEEDDGHNGSH